MLIQNIKIAADALVFSKGEELQILLIKRKNYPDIGKWAFPGGFVEDDEDLEAAAIRELEEETSLKVPSMTQLHTFGKPGRDPRGRTVSVIHYAFTNAAETTVVGQDDAAHAEWVNVKDITDMAFDHKMILDFALDVLAGQL